MTRPSLKELANIQQGEFFIIDRLEPIVMKSTDRYEKDTEIPRYEVWSTAEELPKMIGSGNKLDDLINRFNVKKENIFQLER